MKLVRFLIGSLLVAGMLAVAPTAFAEEGDGGGGRGGPFNQLPPPGDPWGGGGDEGSSRCWNPTCAASAWNQDLQEWGCDYFSYNGKCYCESMTTPEGGNCEAT